MTWVWDASHFPHRVTAAMADLWCDPAETGFAAGCRRYGLSIGGWRVQAVHGLVMVRPVNAVGEGQRSEREWRAAAAIRTRRWCQEARAWRDVERPEWRNRLDLVAAVDPVRLGSVALADHVGEVAALIRRGVSRHFELHLADMIPLGRLLVAAARRGIAPSDVVAATAGRSPASGRVAALGPWSLVGRLDVDAPTVAELAVRPGVDAVPPEPEIHARPWDDPAMAELQADVDVTFWVRDDNATTLLSEPVGLLRRALLAASDRLAVDCVEATPAEVAALLRGETGPSAMTLDDRRRGRRVPPAPVEPPTEALDQSSAMCGPASQELTEAFLAYDALYEAERAQGIGSQPVVGRAVVATTPDEAYARLTPGDILVVRTTAPAFDPVLLEVAGLVTELGGGLSHAAVAARELGIAAVIGLADATTRIPDGAVVEVDPISTTVRVLPSLKR